MWVSRKQLKYRNSDVVVYVAAVRQHYLQRRSALHMMATFSQPLLLSALNRGHIRVPVGSGRQSAPLPDEIVLSCIASVPSEDATEPDSPIEPIVDESTGLLGKSRQ
jgi:hypothetical protein